MKESNKLITYEGIELPYDLQGEDAMYQKSTLEGMACLPTGSHSLKEVIKVKGTIELTHYELIETPIGKSIEGQELTGEKLFVVGNLHFRVGYLEDTNQHRINTTSFYHPFSEYIVLPHNPKMNQYRYPEGTILDMSINTIGDQTFFYSAIFLLVAKLY